MQKRIFSWLLVVVLLASMMVAPAYAEGAASENVTDTATVCGCGCGKKFSEITWKPWKGEVSSDHFYLAEDCVQAEQINVISGERMVLDLRGCTITTSSRVRTFLINGYLGVLDTVGGGRLSGKTVKDNGGLVSVVDNETTGSMFELFSGTVTPAPGSSAANSGGLINLGSGATFRMHGGLLLNGKSGSEKNGGAIAAGATSTIEILGGSVVGGSAGAVGGNIYSSGTVTLKNCSLIGGAAGTTGGNLYISGTLTAENCSIANGTAQATGTYGGGNINTASGSELTFTDCEIYGGYCPGYGGNISFGWGKQTLTNTKVYGGVSGKGGDNIALTHASANMTLDNCVVDGGMSRILGKLTLKGATKISLKNGGLNLTEQTKATVATGLTSGAEVYVSAAAGKTFTGSLTYIKPALRTTLTAAGTTITAAQAADGEMAGYCPHCSQLSAWQPYGTQGAVHTYLTADMADFQELSVDGTLVIDLAGFDITAPGRAFNIASTGSLTLIDSVGQSLVTGSGVDGENGGVITNNGTLNLYSGKYVYANNADVLVAGGGVLYNTGVLNLYAADLDASAYNNTAETALGGAISMAAGEAVTLNMEGGRVVGGSAFRGGGVRFDYNNQVTVTCGLFTGGKAAKGGGNIYCSSTAESASSATNLKGMLTLSKAVITGGTSTMEYAGNIHITRWGAKITDCYITGGKTATYGGNMSLGICPTSGVVVKNTIMKDSTSTEKGGVIYCAGNSKAVTFEDCLITNGTAATGGILYVNNGVLTIKGGELSHGTATGNGGNLYASTTGGVTLEKDANGAAPRILCGAAGTYGGNLYAADLVTVTDAVFCGGTAASSGSDIFFSGTESALTLGSGVTGEIHINVAKGLLPGAVYGGTISNLTCEATDAKFYMDGSVGDCSLVVKEKALYVPEANVVDAAGNAVGYITAEEAVAACRDGQYVKMFAEKELVLTKDLYVDLNGKNITVSGDYAFYGMDSSGDAYATPTGSVTGVAAQTFDSVNAPNGNQYIAVNNGESVSYHRLDLAITGVSIRPTANGMYYSAKWSCDDTLKGMIDSYGVVASVADMPGTDFADDDANLYTAFDQASFQSGAVKKGAVIEDVMLAGSANDTNGKTTVYAKAYIRFVDGPAYISDENIGYSLYDVMKNLDRLITEKPIRYRKYNLSARSFYEQWKDDGMGDWDLKKIPAPTEDDGVIDVLMVGSSFCYYYVQELYALGQAAGIDIRVCNLYYSGCPLVNHYNWWADGKSNYQYYETFHDGRKLTSNVSLEWGLAQHEWDFISIQESSSDTAKEGAQVHFDNTKQYWEPLIDYFMEQFPEARVGWHQTWTNQVEHGKGNSLISSIDDQRTYTQIMEDYAKLICDYYNDGQTQTLLQRIPSGRAWQNTRDSGYDFLCCRLGTTNAITKVAHAGDGYHDGDIGGGQYLNACVWFEIITGKSVLGNSYKPDYATSATLSDALLAQLQVEKTETGYALSDVLVALLQQSAHQAVESGGFQVTQ